jgi:signal peptidase I
MKLLRFILIFGSIYTPHCFAGTELPIIFRMPTEAMAPAVAKGSLIIQEPLEREEAVARGDLVLVKDPSNSNFYAMRVIGLPDERINMNAAGVVFIGRSRLDESAYTPQYSQVITTELTRPAKDARYLKIPSDRFFLLFDQRENPNDSRRLGIIERSQLLARITPWEEVRRTPGKVQRTLERMIAPLSRRLPLVVEQGVQLTSVSALSDEALAAIYTLDVESQQAPNEQVVKGVYSSILGYFCSLPNFGKLGVSVQYTVQDNKGKMLTSLSLSPDKCK